MSETPKESLSDEEIVTDAVPGSGPIGDADGTDGGDADGTDGDGTDGDGKDGGDADGKDGGDADGVDA